MFLQNNNNNRSSVLRPLTYRAVREYNMISELFFTCDFFLYKIRITEGLCESVLYSRSLSELKV